MSTQVDLLNWIMIADRASHHYVGNNTYSANWFDQDGKKVWLIKNSSGHPWDIYTYDSSRIYHWLTENADEGQWSNASAWKMELTPLPVMPRLFTLGTSFTITTPGPNDNLRTVSCGSDNEPLIHLGPTTCITSGPTVMEWGDDVGTQPTILLTYFYGLQREQYFYVEGKGLIEWTHAKLTSGSKITGTYSIDQTTKHTILTNGGCPTPVFPCYSTLNAEGRWIGGAPGGINVLVIPSIIPTAAVDIPSNPNPIPQPPSPVVAAQSPASTIAGSPMNRLLQTPLLGPNGGLQPVWQKWIRETDTKTRPVLTLQGKIAATAGIAGRSEGIATTVQHMNPAGQLTGDGVGFTVGNVPDDATYGKVAQDALTGGLVDLTKPGVTGSLASEKINANVTSNFTNNATVDSIDNGTNATIRAYGPGGVGTTWHQQQGSTVGPELPAFTGTGDYDTDYSLMFDPSDQTFDLVNDGFATLSDGLIFAGALHTVQSGGSGGTGGGGGASGGAGGGGGHYRQSI